MEPMIVSKFERDRLERLCVQLRLYDRLIFGMLFLVGVVHVSNRIGVWNPVYPAGNSIPYFEIAKLLIVIGLLAFYLVPPRSLVDARARLLVLKYSESKDPIAFETLVTELRWKPLFAIWVNTTGRYWAPLQREFEKYRIEPPDVLEEQFRKLDRNPFNVLWARSRQVRRQKSRGS
jgi:hypothetical protein